MPKCCDGKHRHKSQRAADVHIRGLAIRGKDTTGIESYECHHCHFWHVGHVKQKAHKNKYAAPPPLGDLLMQKYPIGDPSNG